jgi:hypothetical protein
MRYKGGSIADPDITVYVEAACGPDAAECVARELGIELHGARVWTEIVDPGDIAMPARLLGRRAWRIRTTVNVRVVEEGGP